MKDLKQQVIKLKPWIILSTYIIIISTLALNFSVITATASSYLSLLTPFFYAIGIAYVLNIPMVRIERLLDEKLPVKSFARKKIRGISITMTIIATLLIVGFLILFITPQLINSIAELINNIGNFFNGLTSNIEEIFAFFNVDIKLFDFDAAFFDEFFTGLGLEWDKIIASATSVLTGAGFGLLDLTVQITTTIMNWFVGFMLSLYLLSSKETFIRQGKKLIATVFNLRNSRSIFHISDRVNDIFTNFVSGQLVEAFIIGILIYIMMLITKMPYAVLISTIVSIMALVPVFGAMLAMSFGFILILSIDPVQAFWFVVLFQTVQLFENNVIYPKVVGKSVGLPGIWTLLSIIIFGGMYGVIGMLIAVPLTASAYVIGSEYVNKILEEKRLIVTTENIIKDMSDDK